MLFVLLIVGAVVLSRAPRSEDELAADEPLVWADVERQFERVDRAGGRPGPAGTGGSDPAQGVGGVGERGRDGGSSGAGRDLSDHRHGTGDSPEGDGPDPP